MENSIVQVTQLTGDYSDNDLEALKEIYEANYRGTVRQKDEEEYYYLVAFTFSRHGKPNRAKDGLRYVWVSQNDLEFIS